MTMIEKENIFKDIKHIILKKELMTDAISITSMRVNQYGHLVLNGYITYFYDTVDEANDDMAALNVFLNLL